MRTTTTRTGKRWPSAAWDRQRMNKTHRKGKAMAKKLHRRWRRRVGQVLSSEGDDLPKCACPTCTSPAEFDSPNDLCEEHWTMWWDWPEDQPQPGWMERNRKPDDAV